MTRRYDIERKTLCADEMIADLKRQLAEAREHILQADNQLGKVLEDYHDAKSAAVRLQTDYASDRDAYGQVTDKLRERAETAERELAVLRRAWELHDSNGAIAVHSFLPLSKSYIDRARAEQDKPYPIETPEQDHVDIPPDIAEKRGFACPRDCENCDDQCDEPFVGREQDKPEGAEP
uniref:Uncharacterized protein n=1 Tax=viral metagenome TaxID=1070528 RepID=A0A6M3IK62_9ZZZZ